MTSYLVPPDAGADIQNRYAEILPVHAALLPTDEVLYFSGDQFDPGQFAHRLFDHARLYDCSSGAISACKPAPGITDLFCCGHARLPDGRVLIAGGTTHFAPYLGSPAAWIYGPEARSFNQVADMREGRWYPTLLTLASGHVLAVSGLDANAANTDQNRDLEVFRGDSWLVQGKVPEAFGTVYPRVHLLPDGRVLFVTPVGSQCATWRPGEPAPTPLCEPPTEAGAGFADYTSVLLPLLPEQNYTARVLVANLAQPRLLDLSATAPRWTDTGRRHVPLDGIISNPTPRRVNGLAVLLPSGDVLSCGGEEAYGDEAHPVHGLELYRPQTNSWVTLPTRTIVTRAYHSVALLLPDGRVWIAGSNARCDWSFHDRADYKGKPLPTDEQEVKTEGGMPVPVDNRELRIEIVEPWYVGRPDRPQFTTSTASLRVGGQLTLTLAGAESVCRVAVLRAGSCTHAFDSDQRYVGLPFAQQDLTLTVWLPANENMLPPGPYLVFVVAQVVDPGTGAVLEVPSLGQWLLIGNGKQSEPEVDEATLNSVPIRPIDPDLLAEQQGMEEGHAMGRSVAPAT